MISPWQIWQTLAAWNVLPIDTQRAILAANDVVVATIKPGIFQYPAITYVFADWQTLTPADQQAKADMPGGVVIKVPKL